jgi:hypothetical protein
MGAVGFSRFEVLIAHCKVNIKFTHRKQYLKPIARNTGADSYRAMNRVSCNNSRWKAANQSKD